MIRFGIDPGTTGAIAALRDGELIEVHDMPVTVGVDPALLVDLLCSRHWHTTVDVAVVEDQHAMPKNGSQGNFSMGRSFGIVLGCLASAGIPVVTVSPAKWKREMRVTADKGTSRRRACELWPSMADSFKRVKDDGRAEAALIARWHHESRQA
jgi:crossover junction endodeoxyribonuclease RuvC